MASNGFEQDELFVPLERLRAAGCEVALAAPTREPIRATVLDDPGKVISPDLTIAEARADRFDALLLPGGLRNPDQLRTNAAAITLIRSFAEAGKPIAAICHGPWLLVEADVVNGKTVTSWPSIRADLENAGANVVDQEVATDGNLITSRNPDDIPAFSKALISALQKERATADA